MLEESREDRIMKIDNENFNYDVNHVLYKKGKLAIFCFKSIALHFLATYGMIGLV